MDGSQDGSLEVVAPTAARSGVAGWLHGVLEFLDAVEDRAATAPSEFTTLLSLRPEPTGTHLRLLELVERLNDPTRSPLLAAPGLRFARLAVLKNVELRHGLPFGPLVVYFRHDGDREDFLHGLLTAAGPALAELLSHCTDYQGAQHVDAAVKLLLAGYVDTRPHPVTRALETFRTLRRTPFARPFAAAGGRPLEVEYGFALQQPFESPVPNESGWVKLAADLTRARSRHNTRLARASNPAAVALRAVHAKHHGLLEATFVVRPDLPAELQTGMFRPNARHHAWIRVSNMSDRVQKDDAPDARGLAIKLEGASAYGTPLSRTLHEAEFATEDCQDFMLANHPTFFVKDVRDYTLLRAFVARRDVAALALFAARRLPEAGMLLRTLGKRVDHALAIEYHSMTAAALGDARAVKYCVRPLPPQAAGAPRCLFGRAANHLRDSLRASLDAHSGTALQLEFCVVFPKDGAPLPVEDARVDWSAFSRCIPVATIEIECQDPCSPARMREAETLAFSPWNSLAEHRPLGSLSRARLAVYRASAGERAALNRALAP